MLFITILLLTGSLHLKAIVFIFLFEIFSSYLEVTVSSSCIEICSASSESTNITWLSTNKVSCSYFLKFLFLYLFFPFCNNMTLIYVNVSERGQPCQAFLLIFVDCVNVVSSFIFMLFSYSFLIAVSKGLGFFLACEMLSSIGLISIKAFS